MDRKLKSKKFFCLVLILIVFCSSLFFLHRPILTGAGGFLAPSSDGEAEVLLVEGTQVIKNGAIDAGVKLLSDGKANQMVVVILHPVSKEDQLFGLHGKYPQLLINGTEKMGMERGKFQVISVPMNSHPITLNEAKFVVRKICQREIKSAILLSEGFHTRRSLAVYSQEGARVGLHIIPYAHFSDYNNDNWWQHAKGVHDFFEEAFKLAYYVLRGYVSIKYL